MIDRNELNEMLTATQMVILRRIKRLSDAAGLVDDIKLALGNDSNSDAYLMCMIQNHSQIRKSLNAIEMDLDADERDLWNKMLHIDQE